MAPKPRKTTPVRELVDMVNYHLRLRDDKVSTPESRRAMASLLESVLMRANCYRGFKYQLSEYDFDKINPESLAPTLRPDLDETRRQYY